MHIIGERLVICRFAARREDVSDEVIKKERKDREKNGQGTLKGANGGGKGSTDESNSRTRKEKKIT